MVPIPDYEKFLTVSIKEAEFEEVITLASHFGRGNIIKDCHKVGAAGQILVRKAFPELKVNGRKYINGDDWCDYIDKKIDTKTRMVCGSYMPHLWLRRDLICDRQCESCNAMQRRCRSLLFAPAQVYIGVEMDQFKKGSKEWTGRIYGFCTTRRLQELYRQGFLDLKYSYKNHSVGFPASMLYSIQSFGYYLRNRHNPSAHLEEFFTDPDLDVMDVCFG